MSVGTRLKASFAATASLFVGLSFAQVEPEKEAEYPDGGEDVVPADQPIDEITVIAPRPIARIRADIAIAERKMYGLFNEMNTDREYEVHCRLEKLYGSNRKKRLCLPQFERGVMLEAWDNLETGYTGSGVPEEELRRKREILRQKMIDFAGQNPDLAQAIYERARLERDLAAAEARMKDAAE